MFTGLVETTGILKARKNNGSVTKLIISSNLPIEEIALGDSIAVNGTCLTVEEKKGEDLQFHVLNETLAKTNLAILPIGGVVNLEQALRLSDRLGGHLVSGHIDITAPLKSIQHRRNDIFITIYLPKELKPYVIHKGSIAINGISLTIAELTNSTFSVCVIPHTWEHTNLKACHPGDLINLEGDIIGKFVARQQQLKHESISMETLLKAGF